MNARESKSNVRDLFKESGIYRVRFLAVSVKLMTLWISYAIHGNGAENLERPARH